MLTSKKVTTGFLILTISLFASHYSLAQSAAKQAKELAVSTDGQANGQNSDLKKTFEEKTQEYNARSGEFDLAKAEKQSRKQVKKNWSKKDTAILVGVIVGIAAIVFFVVKYGKKCLRYQNNCDPSFEENCYCEEYEEEKRR